VRPRIILTVLAVMSTVALTAPAEATKDSLKHKLSVAIAVPGVGHGQLTAVAMDLPNGRLVFARNADVSLEPASNEKLFVTYAALQDLGPEYRFPTEVLGVGHRKGDTWVGQLVLKGFGDPTLTTSTLDRLARIVRRSGIRKVTGGVVADASWFDDRRIANGWLPSFAGVESPPLSALVVDRAVTDGHLAADPALAAGITFKRMLKARGIEAGPVTLHAAGLDAVVIATVYSDPLSDILVAMDSESDNFTAEMVLKAIGATELGKGTTPAGAAIVRRDLVAAGIPLEGVRIVDGSGLSRDDRTTGRALAMLLVLMWDDPTIRPIVVNALAVAGKTGTLHRRFLTGPAYGLVRGKTGTTNISSALSGYVGERYAFVAIANGHPTVDLWAARAAQDGFVTALATDASSG